ncbi:hypothetical protein ABES38_04205 [Bacillus gobiensis]|uniref:hypothetical protein n=1 Tax=Bacillus gobiensis TaxID=1441095 RepID=UPI003D262634
MHHIASNRHYSYSLALIIAIIFGLITINQMLTAGITLCLICIIFAFMSTSYSFIGAGLLGYIFFTILIPKAGLKIAGMPLTVSNVLLVVFLISACFYMLINKQQDIFEENSIDAFVSVFMLVALVFFCGQFIVSFMKLGFKASLMAFIPNVTPIFIFGCSYVFLRNRIDRLLKVLQISLFIVVMFGLLQLIFGHYQTLIPGVTVNYTDYAEDGDRVFEQKMNMTSLGLKLVGTYQNGNLFGSVLLIACILGIGFFKKSESWLGKFTALIIIVFSLIEIIATLSRSALLGLALGLIVLGLYYRRYLIFILATCSFGYWFINLMGYDERLYQQDMTAAGRTFQYEDFFNSFMSMPLLEKASFLTVGKGFGFQSEMIGDYQLTIVESGILNLIMYSGLFGLFLYLAPLFFSGYAISKIRYESNDRFFIICVFSAMIGMWGQMSIDQLLNLPPTSNNYWILTFTLLLLIRNKSNSATSATNTIQNG